MHNSRMSGLVSSSRFARARRLSEQRVRQLLAAGKVAGAIRVGERWAIPANAVIRRVPGGRPPCTRAGMLRQAARACERALTRSGVQSKVVGSLAYGAVHPESDLDLLVLSHAGKTWGQVRAVVDEAARPYGIPVDVIFADTLPRAVIRAMLKDARGASEL